MSKLETVMLWVLGVFYVLAGAMHFVKPDAYLPIMPPYLPAHMALIYVSGAAEVLGGIGVLIPKTRRCAAWGLVALLLAVWPANVHMALENVPMFGAEEGFGAGNWVRVAGQVPLIAWAWWFTRPETKTEGQDPDSK